MDISYFMSNFLNFFLDIFKFIYNTLDSITFFGVSFLKYTIAIFVLYPLFTTLFTLITSRNVYDNIEKRTRKKEKGD